MRVRPTSSLASRALGFATYRLSRLGESYGIDWLTYNPLQLHSYHTLAKRDAAAVMDVIEVAFPSHRRVADVGAGSGAFAAEAMRRGWHVEACEYTAAGRAYQRLQGLSTHRLNLDRKPPARLTGPFDLAYCFEVAEHCSPEQGDQLVSFLAELAPTTLFTAAVPGQGGLGHVNERNADYWKERFAERGVSCSESRTLEVREAFASHRVGASWLRENLLVFERQSR